MMIRFAGKSLFVLGFLLSAACGDTGESPVPDTQASFPTTDTPGPIAPSDTSPSPDTGPTPEDTTITSDTMSMDDTAGTQDTALSPDTATPPAPADTVSPDSSVPHDTAMPDTGPQDTVSPDSGNPNQGLCNPVGTWILNVSSAALPGEGCGDDGSAAQGNKQQVLIVSKGPGNTFSGILKDNNDPPPEIEITAMGQQGACNLKVSILVSVSVPGAGDIEGGVASLHYQYDLKENDSSVEGTGGVTTSFVTDSNKVIAECTEPIDISGSFQAQ